MSIVAWYKGPWKKVFSFFWWRLQRREHSSPNKGSMNSDTYFEYRWVRINDL